MTVIGVAPVGFSGASPVTATAELWIPATAAARVAPELATLRDRRLPNVEVIGRLRPGVNVDQAELALETVARRVDEAHGEPNRDSNEPRIGCCPAGGCSRRERGSSRTIGFPVVLVFLVLLMACGNVANMVLARGATRHREFALRLALGASSSRVVRQLVTESVMLSGLGAVAGAAVAAWLLWLFGRMRPVVPTYVEYDVQFHWGALARCLMAGLSTVAFSLAPSRRASRLDIQSGLKPNAPSSLHGGDDSAFAIS